MSYAYLFKYIIIGDTGKDEKDEAKQARSERSAGLSRHCYRT